MKKLFYLSLVALLSFEIINIYFIMPFPGSQAINSIQAAYFLHKWRWAFRTIFFIGILYGFNTAGWRKKWIPLAAIFVAAAIIYAANFVLSADKMFLQPNKVLVSPASTSKVDQNQLVIGIVHNGQAKAYPIQYLGYHHQVLDTVGSLPVMVTYCTVCRTGRVYEPKVKGKYEKFRLVGMDHFNAMFEDGSTRSWWQQATGKAIAGKLKGEQLPEVFSRQTSLKQWLLMHPQSLIMQADTAFTEQYNEMRDFETGKSKGTLTKMDKASWKNKSWVVGVLVNGYAKAYDWNMLKQLHIINDHIGTTPVVVILSSDNKSFFAYKKEDEALLRFKADTLYTENKKYNLQGNLIGGTTQLTSLPAYQEFWHSWQNFHPNTLK